MLVRSSKSSLNSAPSEMCGTWYSVMAARVSTENTSSQANSPHSPSPAGGLNSR